MSDPVFEAFRRKLADVVTVAINEGKRVSSVEPDTYCPLGCLPVCEHWVKNPRKWAASIPWGITDDAAGAFISGFDGHSSGDGPYYDLGKLYRARFP